MRYKNGASEASDLQKTYAHFEYPGAPAADNERAWELALENGTYELTVSIGDTAGPFDSEYVLRAEGQALGPRWDAGEPRRPVAHGRRPTTPRRTARGFRSTLMTGVVQVEDGRLTLDSIGGANTEIQWLEVQRIPDLTPDDGPLGRPRLLALRRARRGPRSRTGRCRSGIGPRRRAADRNRSDVEPDRRRQASGRRPSRPQHQPRRQHQARGDAERRRGGGERADLREGPTR